MYKFLALPDSDHVEVTYIHYLRVLDLNQRPSVYETDELNQLLQPAYIISKFLALAGVERFELSSYGFGDRYSTIKLYSCI